MAKLPSLPEGAHLSELFALFPHSKDSLMAFTEAVMRAEGDLDIATREMIAAYVSGLNRCTFCHGSHAIYARAFGIGEDVLAALLDDADSAPVGDDLKVLLSYLKKLNTLPARIRQADIDAVLAAGWSERALFEAVQIAGMFNMMNRIVEGTGVSFDYGRDESVHPARQPGVRAQDLSYVKTPMGKPRR